MQEPKTAPPISHGFDAPYLSHLSPLYTTPLERGKTNFPPVTVGTGSAYTKGMNRRIGTSTTRTHPLVLPPGALASRLLSQIDEMVAATRFYVGDLGIALLFVSAWTALFVLAFH